MNIGIIHITDLHFTEKTEIVNKIQLLKNIATSDLNNSQGIYLLITGDIAYSGKASEYDKAFNFFLTLLNEISEEFKGIPIKIIFVPGNHDCNFTKDTSVRKLLLQNLNLSDLDDSVFEQILLVQDEFWQFYSRFQESPKNKIKYEIIEEIDNKKIIFTCFNTAWASTKKETPGTLLFPIQENVDETSQAHLSISLYHHPSNWLNPKNDNNAKEFQLYLDKISAIQFIGHEHRSSFANKKDLDVDTESLIVNGKSFNLNGSPSDSGFNTLKINIDSCDILIRKYSFNNSIFKMEREISDKITKKQGRVFKLSPKIIEKSNIINIPLKFDDTNINLSDIFIFPDLEILGSEGDSIDEYIDSSELFSNSTLNYSILDGDSQIGKTSLLNILYLKFYESGKTPIWINGKSIKRRTFDSLIKKNFQSSYLDSSGEYDRFVQLDKKEKVLLIDNFHLSEISSHERNEILKEISSLFGKVIITVDKASNIIPLIHSNFSNYKSYGVKQFGFKKTNDLIEKYYDLKNGINKFHDQEKITQIKDSFDKVRSLMGDELIPSFPIYLLSLIQSVDSSTFNLKETSSAYCYQALITLALLNKAKVSRDDLSIHFNFLKYFAFNLFEIKKKEISSLEFDATKSKYRTIYSLPASINISKNLIDSKILKVEDDFYSFTYKYIYYYLVAEYLSDTMYEENSKKIIDNLLENLHLEENANILVFLAHHTKDYSFIEDSCMAAMKTFVNIPGITLEKNCNSFTALNEITSTIADDVIENEKKPFEERERALIEADKNNAERKKSKLEDENIDNQIINFMEPFYKSYRSIEIVGQIVKNRKGSLPRKELVFLISEIYNTGFRTISSIIDIVNSEKDEYTLELIEKYEKEKSEKYKEKQWILDKGNDKEKLKKRIKTMFNLIQFETCLSVFSKIIFSVGIKDFKEIYDEVSKQIGTPAAKIVSFSINSYFNKISTVEVERLAKEFENNFVATFILKSRVRSYIYNNFVDRVTKQKLASILHMKIAPVNIKK